MLPDFPTVSGMLGEAAALDGTTLLVLAAAASGIVTGLAFGLLAGAWRARRAARGALGRLAALAEGDAAPPVPDAARGDLGSEIARATERIAAMLTAARGRETALRREAEDAAARCADADRRLADAEARHRDGDALARAVAEVLAAECAAGAEDEDPRAAA